MANIMAWLMSPVGPPPLTARQLGNKCIRERMRRRWCE